MGGFFLDVNSMNFVLDHFFFLFFQDALSFRGDLLERLDFFFCTAFLHELFAERSDSRLGFFDVLLDEMRTDILILSRRTSGEAGRPRTFLLLRRTLHWVTWLLRWFFHSSRVPLLHFFWTDSFPERLDFIWWFLDCLFFLQPDPKNWTLELTNSFSFL